MSTNIKDQLKQRLPLIVLILAVASFIAGIVVFIAAGKETVSYRVTLFRIAGILFFLICGLAVLYFRLSRDQDPNFFLYDETVRRNIPLSELRFDDVNERMEFFLKLIVEDKELRDKWQLWQGAVFADDGAFGTGAVYRPLTVYKMLYDLILYNDDVHWNLFENASLETIRLMANSLSRAQDNDMAQAIVDLCTRNNIEESANIRDFLLSNQRYIQTRMLRYVTQNIDLFY